MPILLKTPFRPGDNDPTAPDGYKFCQLVNLYHSGLTMAVTLEYQFGHASGDYYETWTRGPGSPTKVTEISGMRVAQLWGTMPKDGESVGEAVRRAVYEYLIDSGEVEGEIQNNPPLPPAPEPTLESAPVDAAAEEPAESAEAPVEAPAADAENAPAESEKTTEADAPADSEQSS